MASLLMGSISYETRVSAMIVIACTNIETRHYNIHCPILESKCVDVSLLKHDNTMRCGTEDIQWNIAWTDVAKPR